MKNNHIYMNIFNIYSIYHTHNIGLTNILNYYITAVD
jgi:hypothetical protein